MASKNTPSMEEINDAHQQEQAEEADFLTADSYNWEDQVTSYGQANQLTPRWYPLRPHGVQQALHDSTARFRTVPAGRRSGKTEFLKRFILEAAVSEVDYPDAWYIVCAPIHTQAKRIYWRDMKALTPKWMLQGRPSESELTIRLINGAEITVMGMDQPERAEGRPISGIGLDEYGNMRSQLWQENIRPALSDRKGWAWFIGVPEGRNHYFDLVTKAKEDKTGQWANFTWLSSDILDPGEIEAAKNDMDPLTYQQEYEAAFITFAGRAYYAYNSELHAKQRLTYNPMADLILCFDFNVSPGVAVICQELKSDPMTQLAVARDGFRLDALYTGVIDEVHIPRASNTPEVCKQILQRWGHHRGMVRCYGDSTGGNAGTAKLSGSDWDVIRGILFPAFEGRLRFDVPRANPKERSRVNAVNARCKTVTGLIRLLVDPIKAPFTAKDLDGVRVVEDGSGEIDKNADPNLTHLTDALGYYIQRKFPIGGGQSMTVKQF